MEDDLGFNTFSAFLLHQKNQIKVAFGFLLRMMPYSYIPILQSNLHSASNTCRVGK